MRVIEHGSDSGMRERVWVFFVISVNSVIIVKGGNRGSQKHGWEGEVF